MSNKNDSARILLIITVLTVMIYSLMSISYYGISHNLSVAWLLWAASSLVVLFFTVKNKRITSSHYFKMVLFCYGGIYFINRLINSIIDKTYNDMFEDIIVPLFFIIFSSVFIIKLLKNNQ